MYPTLDIKKVRTAKVIGDYKIVVEETRYRDPYTGELDPKKDVWYMVHHDGYMVNACLSLEEAEEWIRNGGEEYKKAE